MPEGGGGRREAYDVAERGAGGGILINELFRSTLRPAWSALRLHVKYTSSCVCAHTRVNVYYV